MKDSKRIFPHNSYVGSEVTTSQKITELIDAKKYQNNFPNSYPEVTSFQLISLSDDVKVRINNGEIQTINKNWQIRFDSNIEVKSCEILTNGVTVIWSGILS